MKFTDLWPSLYPDGNETEQLTFWLAVVVIIASLFIFINTTIAVNAGGQLSYDRLILEMMRTGPQQLEPIGPGVMTEIVKDLSAIGSKYVLAVLTMIVACFLLLRKHYFSALVLLVITGSGVVVIFSAKAIMCRPRPEIITHMAEVSSQSYPSGHSSLSAIVYLTLGTMVARVQSQKWIKAYCIVVALLLTLISGITRLYLGVHYPSDVIAGWTLGVAWALICWILFGYMRTRFQAKVDSIGS